MEFSMESMIAFAIGIGLAAASGLRVFLPLLAAGVAARMGALPLADGFQWLASTQALIALSTASVLEVIAYAIPGVDHLLDLLAAPAAFAGGVVASAAVMVDVPPAIMWPVAIIAGGGVAATTKATSAVVRAKSGLFTAGVANPIVSTTETAGAAGIAIVAIAVPLICLALVALLLIGIARRLTRRARVPHHRA